ncbi:hypothetical protein BVC80_1793g36 [Macleaya cordata]|uniref:Uncharacterized protein n=1 Tax=Macleaya cordata TaxID=56857 RepID=A0A200QPP6_MACCD|nr:hypothetical protein BVC80_1793g36 [Macleaya cordata]
MGLQDSIPTFWYGSLERYLRDSLYIQRRGDCKGRRWEKASRKKNAFVCEIMKVNVEGGVEWDLDVPRRLGN